MRLTQLLDARVPDPLLDRVVREQRQAIKELQAEVRRLAAPGAAPTPLWEPYRGPGTDPRVTLASAEQEIAFFDLDGDRDAEYLIRGLLVDSTTTDGLYELRINGASAGPSEVLSQVGTSITGATHTPLVVAQGSTSSSRWNRFEGQLWAVTGVGRRVYFGRETTTQGSTGVNRVISGTWNNDTINITSLGIRRTASTLAAGSWVELYRRAR